MVMAKRTPHIGSQTLAEAQTSKPVILPIFGKNFEGHGITKPTAQATRYGADASGATRFEGESDEGWGIHANQTIDCINVTKLKRWDISYEDTWELLFNLEVGPEEIGLKNPAQALISRIVITVNLMPNGTLFIPDPRLFAVQSYYPGEPVDGIYCALCLRPAYNTYQVEFRRKMARRRKSVLEKCL